MTSPTNGKGRAPEKGVNWSKFREGHDRIFRRSRGPQPVKTKKRPAS